MNDGVARPFAVADTVLWGGACSSHTQRRIDLLTLHTHHPIIRHTRTQNKSAAMLPSTASNLAPQNLLIGIPKKGRLNEKVSKLLDGAGLEYRRVSRRWWMGLGGERRTYYLVHT